MEQTEPLYFDDLAIKLHLENLVINILCIRYEPPLPTWNVENHFHTSYELHFIPAGKGSLRVNKSKYDLHQGIFYLTGPNIYHEQITDKMNPMAEFSISFEMSHAKKRNNKKQNHTELDIIKSAFDDNCFWIGMDQYSNIELFEKIFWELQSKQAGYRFNVQSMVIQIIINSARCFMQKKESLFSIPEKISDDKRRFILDFYLGEHYKTLTIDELVSKLDVSKRQLNRIIKHYYDTTFKSKLMTIRLQNAMHLLENTNLPIEKICENVGFSSLSHFYRSFKNFCGVTPKEFRDKSEVK